jgi:hypothetical protein
MREEKGTETLSPFLSLSSLSVVKPWPIFLAPQGADFSLGAFSGENTL